MEESLIGIRRCKKDTDSRVFSQSEVLVFSTLYFFLHSTLPCNDTYSSKPLYIQTPPTTVLVPKIYIFFVCIIFIIFSCFFFFNTTNRPLGRQCKSRNSVKLLRNAVVGFGNVIFSFCCSDLLPFYRVYVFSFLYLPPPVFFFCLYCLSFIRSAHIAPLT